jgi:hypothetical protein
VGAVAPLPISFERPDLETAGFVGWRKWDELRSSNLREVPSAPAVYVAFRSTAGAPIFLDTNPGGRFKEQDPTVPIEVLSANWVPSSQVVYIGKANVAGSAAAPVCSLRGRREDRTLGWPLHLATP